MHWSHPGRRHASGSSLLEVLIAIVVLSFGLLGMVGLQAKALQNNRQARLESVAVDRARELAEMMRGNKVVAVLSVANPYFGDFVHPLVPATSSNCLSIGLACADATAVANAELTDWLARVDADLPGARVTICADSAPYDEATGRPRWACAPGTDITVIKIGWSHLSTNEGLTKASDRTVLTTSAKV